MQIKRITKFSGKFTGKIRQEKSYFVQQEVFNNFPLLLVLLNCIITDLSIEFKWWMHINASFPSFPENWDKIQISGRTKMIGNLVLYTFYMKLFSFRRIFFQIISFFTKKVYIYMSFSRFPENWDKIKISGWTRRLGNFFLYNFCLKLFSLLRIFSEIIPLFTDYIYIFMCWEIGTRYGYLAQVQKNWKFFSLQLLFETFFSPTYIFLIISTFVQKIIYIYIYMVRNAHMRKSAQV